MSYSEKDGQVILTMSREDYADMLMVLKLRAVTSRLRENRENMKQLLNRLNEGNPHYTPYQVEGRERDWEPSK